MLVDLIQFESMFLSHHTITFCILSAPSLVAQAQMAQKKKAVAKKSTAKPSQHDSVNLGKMVDNERLRSGMAI